MPARRIKQLIVGCFVCGMLLSAPGWAERAGAPRQSIDIPAGDLQASLERLAKQTGIEFIYDSSQLKDLKAAAISGAYTPKDALLLLLAGTQLRLVEYPSGALLITAQDPGGLPAPGRGQTPGPAATAGPARPNPSENGDSSLEAIIVTGTHIRGEPLVGSALSIYTREDIDQSGSATLEQFARQMPENFAAVDSVANLNTNANLGIFPQGASSNIFGGAAFDLNGLGVGSTLTLLNGHRLAPGGFDGSFVDISQIPLSAIDHLEVLDDGASAIYGSDAIAGVVNIVTRKDFERAQTGVLYGGATEGGAGEYALSQLFGHSWGRGDVFLDYEYDNQGGLDAAQRSWIPDQLGPDSLIPENRRNSFFSAINQDIASATTLSADILYGVRDFKNNSPLGVADEVAAWQSSVGHSTESTATLTLSQGLIADWTADFTGDFSEIRQQSKLEDPALGEVGNQFVSNSRIIEGDVLSSGSLYALPGGEAKASLGGSYRLEAFNDSEQAFAAAVSTRLARHVASGYGEIRVPVMGGSFTLPGVRRLELSGAFRYDHYSEFGPTSNPKYGLLWEPVSGFDLRGTFGTSCLLYTSPSPRDCS